MAVPSAAKPASPRLPASMTVSDADDLPLVDDGEWYRLSFDGGDFGGVEAEGFTMEAIRMSRVDLSGGRWRKATVRDAVWRDGNLANTHVEDSGVHRSSFDTMRMTGLQWSGGVVRDVTFTGCRLDLSGFRFSRLRHVVFTDCRLTGADFTNTEFTSVRFSGCDLTGVRLHHATMTATRFADCLLEDVTGVEALRGAVVSGADLLPLTYSMAAGLGITVEHDRGD